MPKSNKLFGREDEVRQLFNKGFSDQKIADVVGVTRQGIQKFRKIRKWLKKANFNGSNFKLEGKENIILEMNKEGKSDVEIANRLGVMPSAICTFRKRHNVLGVKQYNFHKVSDPTFLFDPNNPKELMARDFGQVLIGSLLGDGYIPTTRVMFCMSHCISSKKYLKYKVDMLKPFSFVLSDEEARPNPLVKNPQPQIKARTPCYQIIKHFKKIFYPYGKKIIPLEYIDLLDMRGLLIWIFDDGNISVSMDNYNSCRITIATCSFQEEEINKAIQILKRVFGFQNITMTKRHEIYISKKDTIKLCKDAKSFLPYCYEEKTKRIRYIADAVWKNQ